MTMASHLDEHKTTHEFRTFILYVLRVADSPGWTLVTWYLIFMLNTITVRVTWTIAHFFRLILCHSLPAITFSMVWIFFPSEQKMDHFDWMMIVFYFWVFIWKWCCCRFFALLLINSRQTGLWMSWTMRSFRILIVSIPEIHLKCVVSYSINNNEEKTQYFNSNSMCIYTICVYMSSTSATNLLYFSLSARAWIYPQLLEAFCLSYFGCTVWINVCICYSINMVSFVRTLARSYIIALRISTHTVCALFALLFIRYHLFFSIRSTISFEN